LVILVSGFVIPRVVFREGGPMPAVKSVPASKSASGAATASAPKPEPKILFQQFFKSVGPRTYAAQVKEAGNGNHFLVLTEGKRDDATGDVRKTKLFVFSEDFPEFFRLLHATAQWIRANPVSPEVAKKRKRYWAKKDTQAPAPSAATATTPRPGSNGAGTKVAPRPETRSSRRPAARS
jgi:hypothetical protein